MRRTLLWGVVSVGAGALGFYTAFNSSGWPKWLLFIGSAVMLVGGLWQAGRAMGNK